MKVMIVDDEKPIRQWFEFILRDITDLQIEITASCPNGLEALEACAQKTPHVIFTDIIMPVMNGIELIQKVKTYYPQVAVLILSNFDDFEYVRKGLKLGAYDYLLKVQTDDRQVIELLHRLNNELAISDDGPICDSEIVNKMVAYIHENYANKVKLTDLSKSFSYHPDYLSQLFKKHIGENFNAYLNEYRIEQAKILLSKGGLQIKEVASAVGFANGMHFSTVFKNITGVSPKKYTASEEI